MDPDKTLICRIADDHVGGLTPVSGYPQVYRIQDILGEYLMSHESCIRIPPGLQDTGYPR